ncbi:Zinc finger C2H2-type [Trinorchestia longiramus]|nr:Zinc finger C2H2-type [Trinorchestia longiramus]
MSVELKPSLEQKEHPLLPCPPFKVQGSALCIIQKEGQAFNVEDVVVKQEHEECGPKTPSVRPQQAASPLQESGWRASLQKGTDPHKDLLPALKCEALTSRSPSSGGLGASIKQEPSEAPAPVMTVKEEMSDADSQSAHPLHLHDHLHTKTSFDASGLSAGALSECLLLPGPIMEGIMSTAAQSTSAFYAAHASKTTGPQVTPDRPQNSFRFPLSSDSNADCLLTPDAPSVASAALPLPCVASTAGSHVSAGSASTTITRPQKQVARQFYCDECNFSSAWKQCLVIHQACKHAAEKPFACSFCPYATARKHLLKDHLLSRHSAEKPFSCDLCDFSTATKYNLKLHVTSKHSGDKPFKCDLCEYSTARKYHLKDHKVVNHGVGEPIQCPLCDFTTARKNDLKNHHISKHSAEKRFICDFCDYSTARKHSFKQHQLAIHSSKKPFKCNLCEYTCSRKACLKDHTSARHSSMRPYKCELCDYCTARKQDLKQHMATKHESQDACLA